MSRVKNGAKLGDLVGYRVRVISQDGRVYIGELLAFDQHMNIVIGECVEERVPNTQLDKLRGGGDAKCERRVLGLVVLRGEQVLSTVVEDGPSTTKRERALLKKQIRKRKSSAAHEVPPATAAGTAGTAKGSDGIAKASDGPAPKRFQPPPGFRKR